MGCTKEHFKGIDLALFALLTASEEWTNSRIVVKGEEENEDVYTIRKNFYWINKLKHTQL